MWPFCMYPASLLTKNRGPGAGRSTPACTSMVAVGAQGVTGSGAHCVRRFCLSGGGRQAEVGQAEAGEVLLLHAQLLGAEQNTRALTLSVSDRMPERPVPATLQGGQHIAASCESYFYTPSARSCGIIPLMDCPRSMRVAACAYAVSGDEKRLYLQCSTCSA